MPFTYLYNHLCWTFSTLRRMAAVSNLNPKEEVWEGFIVQTINCSTDQANIPNITVESDVWCNWSDFYKVSAPTELIQSQNPHWKTYERSHLWSETLRGHCGCGPYRLPGWLTGYHPLPEPHCWLAQLHWLCPHICAGIKGKTLKQKM